RRLGADRLGGGCERLAQPAWNDSRDSWGLGRNLRPGAEHRAHTGERLARRACTSGQRLRCSTADARRHGPRVRHTDRRGADRRRTAALSRELLESLRRGVRMQFAVINLPAFACAAVRLGLGDELVQALAGHPTSRWTEAVCAYVAGDFLVAAEILGQAGAK